MKQKFLALSLLIFFLTNCASEKNLLVKQVDGNFLVIAYGDSRKKAELSAYSSASNKCSSIPLLKTIKTQYIGAVSEKETQIAAKVLDMLNQVTNVKGVSIPTSATQDLENYKTELSFSCE